MDVTRWRYRKKSTLFIFRIMRFTGLRDLNFFSSVRQLKMFISYVKRNLNRNSKLLQMIFGNLFIFPFFIFFYRMRLTLNKSLEKYVESIKPDLIFFHHQHLIQ